MANPFPFLFGLSVSATLLCGCGSESANPDGAVVVAADGMDDGQVTFLVKGMTDRLSIY